MTDVLDLLDDRDDVKKTEYTVYEDGDNVYLELWHDVDGLQAVFQKTLDGVVSPKGIRDYAKERALAVRETRVDYEVPFSNERM